MSDGLERVRHAAKHGRNSLDRLQLITGPVGAPRISHHGPPTWLDIYVLFREAFAGFAYEVRMFTRPGPRGEIELHIITDEADRMWRELVGRRRHPWEGPLVMPDQDGEPVLLEDPVPHRATVVIDVAMQWAMHEHDRRALDAHMRDTAQRMRRNFEDYLRGRIDQSYRSLRSDAARRELIGRSGSS